MNYKWLYFLVILVACHKDTARFAAVQVIGHGATGLQIQNRVYHDNTLEAIDFSLAMDGCGGVEVDVQLSKDKNLWLYHDENLDSETNSSGCIVEVEDEVLRNTHYSTAKREQLTLLKNISFKNLKGKFLLLDVRHQNACKQEIINDDEVIMALNEIEALRATDIDVYISISNPAWVESFKGAGYRVVLSANTYEEYRDVDPQFVRFDGVICKNKGISKNEVNELKQMNKKVFIFEIRAPKETRLALSKLPDGVVTDDIRTALIEKN